MTNQNSPFWSRFIAVVIGQFPNGGHEARPKKWTLTPVITQTMNSSALGTTAAKTAATKALPPAAIFGIAFASALVIGGAVAGILYATRVIPHYPPNFDQVDPAKGTEYYQSFIDGMYKDGYISLEKHKELQGSFDTTKARWMTLAHSDEGLRKTFYSLHQEEMLDFVDMVISGSWYN
jgi:hypothetical protein